ncbi:hypothetical protein ACWGQ5_02430 [Streptomyces sp. NPDC055722]
MARTTSGHDHLPIYEDLVRERGDAIAEAQLAAQHMQHQAAVLLTAHDAAQPAHHYQHGSVGGTAGGPLQ